MALLSFSLSFLFLLFAYALYRALRFDRLRHRCVRGRYYCAACHYDVTETLGLACPECGKDLAPRGIAYAERPARISLPLVYFGTVFVSVPVTLLLIAVLEEIGFDEGGLPLESLWLVSVGNLLAAPLLLVTYLGPCLFVLHRVQALNDRADARADQQTIRFMDRVRANRNRFMTNAG